MARSWVRPHRACRRQNACERQGRQADLWGIVNARTRLRIPVPISRALPSRRPACRLRVRPSISGRTGLAYRLAAHDDTQDCSRIDDALLSKQKNFSNPPFVHLEHGVVCCVLELLQCLWQEIVTCGCFFPEERLARMVGRKGIVRRAEAQKVVKRLLIVMR
jgi:hypothetical protein